MIQDVEMSFVEQDDGDKDILNETFREYQKDLMMDDEKDDSDVKARK